MKLDLSRFRGGDDHLERRYDPAAFAREDDFRVVAPAELSADLRKDGRQVRLVGRVKTTLEADCSRCVEPFTIPVDSAFDLMFLPADENTGEGEREVQNDDLGVSFYSDEVIDLGEVMREQFLLALPMKPLCQAECQGLCPECGVNRNRESCSCDPHWTDPRLDALRALRPTPDAGSGESQ